MVLKCKKNQNPPHLIHNMLKTCYAADFDLIHMYTDKRLCVLPVTDDRRLLFDMIVHHLYSTGLC